MIAGLPAFPAAAASHSPCTTSFQVFDIGSPSASIAGGHWRIVTIHLNWAGRVRLRETKRALRARLTLAGSASGRRLTKNKHVTLRPARSRHRTTIAH